MTDIVKFIKFLLKKRRSSSLRNHLNHLKDMYYETMEKYLEYYDIDIDTVYRRKEFEMDYENHLIRGLQVVLFVSPFIFTLEDEVPDLDNVDLSDIKVNLDHRYYERLQGVVDDMIAWGKL